MRRHLARLVLLLAVVLVVAPPTFATGTSTEPVLEATAPTDEPLVAELVSDTAPDACLAELEADDEIEALVEVEVSCLVCWRDRDCNSYCGGPWGDCYQGCCACTQ